MRCERRDVALKPADGRKAHRSETGSCRVLIMFSPTNFRSQRLTDLHPVQLSARKPSNRIGLDFRNESGTLPQTIFLVNTLAKGLSRTPESCVILIS